MYNGMHVQRALEFNQKVNETLLLLAPTGNRFLSEELEKSVINALTDITAKTTEEIKEAMLAKPNSQ